MKCCEEHYLTCRYVHQLGKFLQEIKFLLWIVLCSMFQHFTKLINHYQQELSFLLALSIVILQAIEDAIRIAFHIKSLAQQG